MKGICHKYEPTRNELGKKKHEWSQKEDDTDRGRGSAFNCTLFNASRET